LLTAPSLTAPGSNLQQLLICKSSTGGLDTTKGDFPLLLAKNIAVIICSFQEEIVGTQFPLVYGKGSSSTCVDLDASLYRPDCSDIALVKRVREI